MANAEFPIDPSGVANRLLTGAGRFCADEDFGDALHLAVLRSPEAHGLIAELDVEAARACPGVHLVLTAENLAGIGNFRVRSVVQGLDGPMFEPPRPVLATDRVVHVGQPVAAVIADSPEAAADALEAIQLDIQPLPVVSDPLSASRIAPIWDGAPGNVCFRWKGGNSDQIQSFFDSADEVVELTISHPRVAICPVEPRACLATYSSEDGHTLITPSQNVVALRTAFSKMLNLDPARLRVVTRDVGGSFAVKIWPYPEQALALIGAERLGRAVRWVQERSETFTADVAGRGRIDRAAIALNNNGQILAVRIDAVAEMGAFTNPAAATTVSSGAVRPFQQVYDIPGQHYGVTAVFTNAVPTDAYRGAGKPESGTTLERLIEAGARAIGMDPWDVRKKNLIAPTAIPYLTPMGETIDAGDFPTMAAKLETAADWSGRASRREDARARAMLHGAAAGFAMHASGGSTEERSLVRAMADGTVLVRSGSMDSGQSHRDSLARVAAEALDLPIERIRVEQGDSAWLVRAMGAGGSNLMPVAGNTVHRTAKAMLDRAKERAGEMLEAATVDLDYSGGTFRIAGTDRTVSLANVAQQMEAGGGCEAELDFEGIHTTWPHCALAAEVEVEPQTGAVHVTRLTGITDVGRVINPPAAFGQVIGGLAQGLGEALMEGMVFDADGQPKTGSMMDYALPRADQIPFLTHDWSPTDSPNTIINAKGIGEMSIIGAAPVVINAILDALAPFGVTHLEKPVTSEKIWRAISGVDAG